jgi:importin subunit alpha-2
MSYLNPDVQLSIKISNDVIEDVSVKAINSKAKNLKFMINIRKNDRKDIIRNKRFLNVKKILGRQLSDCSANLEQAESSSVFPERYSHLSKVKDSQKIYQIIKDIDTCEIDKSKLEFFFKILQNGNRIDKHRALIYIRRILTDAVDLPIQEFIDLGGISVLIGFAKDTSELHLRLEATWCLANLCSGNPTQTYALLNKNIIEIFKNILDDEYSQIVEQAIWGLGNLIPDSKYVRETMLNNKIFDKLIDILQKSQPLKIVRIIIWCLSSLLRTISKVPINSIKVIVQCLILTFITIKDDSVKSDCLQGLKKFCKKKFLTFFTKTKFLQNLRNFYQFLYKSTSNYKDIKEDISNIHSIIGNITNGDDFDTSMVIDTGFLSDLTIMLQVQDQMCQREICWIISNIAAGNPDQISSLFNQPNLFENIISLVKNTDTNIQQESIWVLCNMTKNINNDQLKYLIHCNIISLFADILSSTDQEKIIVLILEALPNILIRIQDEAFFDTNSIFDKIYECGLADLISNLQRHESDIIYEKALYILEQHFDLMDY